MPGCCVSNCFNSTEKDFSMRIFPLNVERKAIWIKNIYSEHGLWRPTKNLFVCEVNNKWYAQDQMSF
ncbi:hypothetical protein ALC57_15409 [Trachymyrmex cornetzi]|uniref:THAP-type domain-containing protein n=1 Tax=Trachymyrmex cornetzi TaxID=471704 RepID=A0A151IXC6_9HYME|nr:hypothetical protein ALC57_15409 [Trachymyrmex cornetzi]